MGSNPRPHPPIPDEDDLQTIQGSSTNLAELVYRARQWFDQQNPTRPSVIARGCLKPDLIVVGESPGPRDLRHGDGTPFRGPAGELLFRMLEEIHIQTSEKSQNPQKHRAFFTNSGFWERRAGEQPNTQERRAAAPIIGMLIHAIQPKLILALGAMAAKTLIDIENENPTMSRTFPGVGRLRGRTYPLGGVPAQWFPVPPEQRPPVLVTWHPAYLLREPAAKIDAREDFARIQGILES